MKGCQIGTRKRESLPKSRYFLSFHSARTCTTIGPAWTVVLPSETMPSTRPKLTRPDSTRPYPTLDEQSFQGLLAAAFTIQEHNDRRKQTQSDAAELPAEL